MKIRYKIFTTTGKVYYSEPVENVTEEEFETLKQIIAGNMNLDKWNVFMDMADNTWAIFPGNVIEHVEIVRMTWPSS